MMGDIVNYSIYDFDLLLHCKKLFKILNNSMVESTKRSKQNRNNFI